MSVNLIDLVKSAVGSQLGPLAAILDESEQKTHSVLNTVIPAMLGGLMTKSSTNDSANEVYKTLDCYDGGILDHLGGLLAGGNHIGLLNTGSGLLGIIFGNNQSTIVGTIAKMIDLSDSKTATVLGLLAPVVMGVLGKQRRTLELDAGGLAGLLAEQEHHLKEELGEELAEAIGIGSISGPGSGAVATHAATSTSRAVSGADNQAGVVVVAAGEAGGRIFKTLLPLIVIGALAFLGYRYVYVTGSNANSLGDIDTSSPDVTGVSVPNLNIPGFDTGAISQTFGGLTDAIGDIKDAASARLAIPEIEKAISVIDGIDLSALAAGPQSEAVGALFGGLIQNVRAALDVAYGIPGVRSVLEPVIAPFLGKFAVFGP